MPTYNAGAALSLHPAVYISAWIFFSNSTIIFNKWLIDDAGFPVILTLWHMVFATLATQVLARTTNILDGRHKTHMNTELYMKTVVPIGLLYSGSMACSTSTFLYLSVSFIQMLKAIAPAITLIVGWFWGVEHPTWTTFSYIMLIVVGVALASAGEVQFSWLGFVFQIAGIIFESIRVIMIQSLMSNTGLSMDPLVSLYYYAPVCAVTNFVLAIATGWDSTVWVHAAEAGFFMLLLNAIVAFLLNVSSVLLIGKTSGLILVLTGVLKNILLVVTAVAIWGTPIAFIQLIGYSLALIGLILYQSGWEGTGEILKSSVRRITEYSRFGNRKPWLLVASLVLSALLTIAYFRGGLFFEAQSPTTETIRIVDHPSSAWLTWIHEKTDNWWIRREE
ncbi:TPT-domain-containing protein [Hypoxylon trugodes]|uniref:TPT-domain-containing protein n=1 Tax=Hypoxylon trugodes TaxID=326681 RepID=UPI00219510C6|nr:TPT-domain-containing protein [Hypoxylon trugodes]KAI1391002.1 TPT-domain-containing protein [Hypoxylon trugodes]